jgi:hypothetical protein
MGGLRPLAGRAEDPKNEKVRNKKALIKNVVQKMLTAFEGARKKLLGSILVTL